MAEIGNTTPIGPAWPSRPVKPAGESGERRSLPRRNPDESGKQQQDDDQQHIDEYA